MNLVVQTAFLGDLLLTVPLLQWIKNTQPHVPLGLVCRKGLGAAFVRLGLVDHVWEIQKKNSKTYNDIRTQLADYDIKFLISPHTSMRTTIFCARIKAEKKITFAKPWNHFVFDERIKWPAQYPEALRLLHLIKGENKILQNLWQSLPSAHHFIVKNKSGYLPPPPDWVDPSASIASGTIEKLRQELRIAERFPYENFVALFPGSVWATKMWKKEGYMELGQKLISRGEKVLIMGGPEEKKLGDEITAAIPGAINLCGQSSLLESLLILSKAKQVVGNDSSSSHMAALMGRPVVSIFGPTVLEFGYRPWAKSTRIFEKEGMNCRPCGLHGHKKCPLGHHNCMKTLEVNLDL